MMQLITYTTVMSLNRITVPKAITKRLELEEGGIVAFYESGHEIVLKKGTIVPVE